jgi:hypothetical protein
MTNISITNVALVARVEITGWTGERVDKAITSKTNRENGTSGKYVKNLLGHHKVGLKRLASIRSEARAIATLKSLPYHSSGWYLVPVDSAETFLASLGKLRDEYAAAGNEFVDGLKTAGVFNQPEFPFCESEIRGKFRFSVHLEPIPTNNGFDALLGLDDCVESLKADLVDRQRETLELATGHLRERLVDRLVGTDNETGLIDKLKNHTGKRKGRFSDTAFTGTVELCDIVESLNLSQDDDIRLACKDIRLALKVGPTATRETATIRHNLIAELNRVLHRRLHAGSVVDLSQEQPATVEEQPQPVEPQPQPVVDIVETVEMVVEQPEQRETVSAGSVLSNMFG